MEFLKSKAPTIAILTAAALAAAALVGTKSMLVKIGGTAAIVAGGVYVAGKVA